MTLARGYKGQLVIDFESDLGVEPGTKAGFIMPFNTCSLGASQNQNDSNTITGRRDRAEPILGNIDVSGDVVVPIDVDNVGLWLMGLFGAPDTTDNGNGTYTHVFKVKDTQPSMVVEKGFPDISQYLKYNGVKINGLSFEFGGDDELVMTLNLVGIDETLSTSPYDPSAKSMTLVRFQKFQASIKEGGVPLGTVTEGNLNIEAGLDTEIYLVGGQGKRGRLPEGQMAVSGAITTLFEDDFLLSKAINGMESSLEITFTNGDNVLSFYIPELKYHRTSPTIEGPTGIVYETPFTAYYADATEESSVVVTLINAVSEY